MTEVKELEKLLSDERERADQHKNNYQVLKTGHKQLQDDYSRLEIDLKSTLEESQMMKDKYTQLIDQLRRELMQTTANLDEVRNQTISKQKLELIKLELIDNYDSPYKQKLLHAETELDSTRADLTKLKYEYSFLKSEYEHQINEHDRIQQEIKLRHNAEIEALRKERESLMSKYSSVSTAESEKISSIQRENTLLNSKVKTLLSEVEELRAKREHLELNSDQTNRLQQKQLAEHAANCKALEAEKQSLKSHIDSLQKEVASGFSNVQEISLRLHELEKENIQLKGRTTEAEHKCKVEITNVKLSMLRERGELERERDKLRNEIQELETQLEISQHEANSKNQLIIDKERDIVRKVQAAREEEWKKLHIIDNERVELETKLQEMERRRFDEQNYTASEKEKLEEQIRECHSEKDSLIREMSVMKTKIQQIESMRSQMEHERSENSDLKNQIHRIETEFGSYVSSEEQLMQENGELRNKLIKLEKDITKIRDNSKDETELIVKRFDQEKLEWLSEKANIQQRINQLENQLSTTNIKLTEATDLHAKRKHQYSTLVSKMKNKLKLYQVKNQELEIERDAIKQFIPADQHNRVKKQLNELLRKHKDFRSVILSAKPSEVTIDDKTLLTSLAQSDSALIATGDHHSNSTLIDYEKELIDIKVRVDEIADAQLKQTIALKHNLLRSVSSICSETGSDDDKDNGTEKECLEMNDTSTNI